LHCADESEFLPKHQFRASAGLESAQVRQYHQRERVLGLLQRRLVQVEQLDCRKLEAEIAPCEAALEHARTPVRIIVRQYRQTDEFGIVVRVEDSVVVDEHAQREVGVALRLYLDVQQYDALDAIPKRDPHQHIHTPRALAQLRGREAVQLRA